MMETNKRSTEISLQQVWKQKKVRNPAGEIKDITILSDVTAEFSGGCVHLVIGPSGSGKTTLLRLINKLESPDQGHLFYRQTDLALIPSRLLRKDIGMVFQTPALFRGTIFDNISFGPGLYQKNLSGNEVDHFLEIVDLKNIDASRDVESLSVGQQQRVAFARALATEPKVLLLDEPTSALDPTAAKNLLDLVKKINRDLGVSIIMVTHIMDHAKKIADMIYLLIEGRIIETGKAGSFFDQPKTAIAKKFISGEL